MPQLLGIGDISSKCFTSQIKATEQKYSVVHLFSNIFQAEIFVNFRSRLASRTADPFRLPFCNLFVFVLNRRRKRIPLDKAIL